MTKRCYRIDVPTSLIFYPTAASEDEALVQVQRFIDAIGEDGFEIHREDIPNTPAALFFEYTYNPTAVPTVEDSWEVE